MITITMFTDAMKVWEEIRANDDDVDVVEDGHDDDYQSYEGVGGDQGSVARGGDPRLEPLC